MESLINQRTIKTSLQGPTLQAAPGRGFLASPLDYGGAPQINSRGFVANAGAMSDIGRGLQVAGGHLDQIQERVTKAINERRLAEAEMTMREADNEVASEIAKHPNNPEKWESIANEATTRISQMLLSKDDAPDVRDAIGIRSRKWQIDSVGSAKVSGIHRQFQLTADTFNAEYMMASNDGRWDDAEAAIQKLDAGGYIAKDRAASMRIGLEKTVKSQNMDNYEVAKNTALLNRDTESAKLAARSALEAGLLTEDQHSLEVAEIGAKHEAAIQADEIQALTLTNPSEAVQRLSDPANFDKIAPGDRAAMIVRAKEVQAAGAGDAFRDIKTRISLGQVGKDESFDGPGMQDLTPSMRDILKSENAARHDEQAKATRIALQNSPAIYENAVGVISKYDPADDSGGLRRAEIGAALETNFSGPYLDELKKRLDERGTRPPNEIDTAPALALIQEWTEGGGLGEYKKPVTQDGAAVMTEPKKVGVTAKTPRSFLGIDYLWPDSGGADVMGQAKPVTEIDPVAQAQAASKQAAIRKAIESEVKAGKFKSNDEVLNRTIELYQQHGGKAPASTAPAQSGASLLLPPPAAAQAEMEKALSILNYKPAK